MTNSVYMTRRMAEELAADNKFTTEVVGMMMRFLDKDWGDLCEEDKAMNEEAIKDGGRVLAVYNSTHGKIYIITDDTKAKPLTTTVLFADEY